MADRKLSAMTELVTPVDEDEIYIRDVSEAAADESKRITVANLTADRSKVIWKDASEKVLTDLNRTSFLNWTTLDLTAYTSANAKLVILQVMVDVDSIGADGAFNVQVRKNGTTPDWGPRHLGGVKWGHLPGAEITSQFIVGLDSGQVIQYTIVIFGTIEIHTWLDVLGYIE